MKYIDLLTARNPELADYVRKHVCAISVELEKVHDVFKEFTDHSVAHSERVLGLAEALAPDGMADFEMALAILFSYFHDWGMVVSEEEYDKFMDSLDDEVEANLRIENANVREGVQAIDLKTGKKLLALEHFRRTHARRSSERIRGRFPKSEEHSWFQHVYIWDTLADLCAAHGKGIEEIIKDRRVSSCSPLGSGATVDTSFLVALTRMADMCHFSRDRALPFLKQQLRFSSRKSERIWEFYEDISDTVPNPQTRRIEISAQCKSYYIHRAIVNNATQIQGELLNSHRLLVEKQSKHQFDWKYVDTSCVLAAQSDYDYHDSRFRLKQEKVVELLMGNRLYRSELYALRECLQNALDAVEAYARKVANHEACIVVDLGADCVIDVYDNGTGMDMEIIDKHFLSVGESAFWYSDRGIDDWGGVRKNRQLIADHGIGTLSYFMIADRVEIFSIYDHAQQPTHVMLDDYLDGVVFKNTPLTSFPSFDPVDVGVSSPWTAHHGTLVRMHLRRRVHPAEVLRFFARHILRIRSRLLVRTPEGMLELPEIWHLRSGVDDRHTDMRSSQSSMIQHDENQRSMVETYSELFEPKKGFYDNPPKDAAVDDNQHVHRESRYRIRVHVDSPYGEPFRLSQNGIAVEDAEEFFRETENPLLFNAYTVDVDLRGTCFQLNADRSRIQENAYNLQIRNELLEAFTKSYFEQISKIEGAVYFSCGGRYYHGMADVLFSGEPLRISFHPILKKVFQDETRNQEYVDRFMRAFKNAKLYCTGLGRNQPLSVRDIENDLSIREIVVRREKHLSKSLWTSDDHGERDRAMDSFMKAVQSRAANMEMLVYLPGNSESFVLPLAKSLGFSVRFENPDFRILEIQRARAPQESTTQPLLMGK